METTAGQILINAALPEDMRDYSRVLDKKGIQTLMTELAQKHPDKYAEINQKLHVLSSEAVTLHGGSASLSLDSFRTPLKVKVIREEINAGVQKILDSGASEKQKNDQITILTSKYIDRLTDLNYDEGLKEDNPLALQVLSGSRGNRNQFRSLRVGDMLVVDHKDKPIPIPILSSYAEGLDPVQYFAGAYGARKGAISTKFATPKAGFLGKQLALASHRLMVTEKDCGTKNGIPVEANDHDNEGSVLAADAGQYTAGTILTPKIMKDLGKQKILARSALTCHAEKGICQRCAGIRERGDFPPLNDNLGIAAAQAISEPLSQSQLSEKHKGGMASSSGRTTKTGLDLINQLVQVPETFHGSAAMATIDGRVDHVEPAPQGGTYVTIGSAQHYVPVGETLAVNKGDMVEAGDVLSSGIPNPAQVTQYKGIGEGRRYFVDQFRKTLQEAGVGAHRRNIELLARGLINHVRVTDPDGPADTAIDDVVEYDDLVRGYQPRFGFKVVTPSQSVGLHLEEPVLHYSIGTRITPSVVKTMQEHKVPAVKAHAEPPSFVPEMTRAMETLTHSNDWMVQLGGFHLKKGLIDSVHKAKKSDLHGTSYIPSLARGVDFGKPPEGIGY